MYWCDIHFYNSARKLGVKRHKLESELLFSSICSGLKNFILKLEIETRKQNISEDQGIQKLWILKINFIYANN